MATAAVSPPVNNTSFKGPFLFVNHDAGHLKARPHRKAVFTHVQGSYSKWKKREDARLFRESVTKSAPFKRFDGADEETFGLDPSNSTSSDDPENTVAVRSPQRNQRPPGPLTILQKGNSDPFDTFAIPIDPKVNDLIVFCRDWYAPAIQRDANSAGAGAADPLADWRKSVEFLCDKCTAYGFLASVASVIPLGPSEADFTMQALFFKTQCMAILRTRLAEKRSLADPSTYMGIYMLINAEINSRNFDGAIFHASMLSNLIQTGVIQADVPFYFKSYYFDYQRAAMSLTRPCFDFQKWIPTTLTPVWNKIATIFPPTLTFEACGQGLDPSIDGETLRSCFTDLRLCLAVFVLTMKDPSIASFASTTFYIRSRVIYNLGRLLNHYLDSMALLSGFGLSSSWLSTADPWMQKRARVQAYASLALHYWARVVSRTEDIQIGVKPNIYSANNMIHERLRDALIESEIHETPAELTRDARLRLWALHIGAIAEQAKAQARGGGAENEWFNVKFAEQAKSMGLNTWQEVRVILQGFAYTDGLQPHGALWFWKTISANDDGGSLSPQGNEVGPPPGHSRAIEV